MLKKLIGIRKSVLEDEAQRAFLKETIEDRGLYDLTVVTGVKDSYMLDFHSYLGPVYKPTDITKFPNPEDSEYKVAVCKLLEQELGKEVIWFDSDAEVLAYIQRMDSEN